MAAVGVGAGNHYLYAITQAQVTKRRTSLLTFITRMHCGGGSIMLREVKAMVSLLLLVLALNNTHLIAGGGLGMALVNMLVRRLCTMPLLERSLLTVTLMLIANALLHLPNLPNPNNGINGSVAENKQLPVAATAVMYCRWALPQVLISDRRRTTPRTAGACVEAVALHLLFTWALALGLGLGLEGVAMAPCCSHLAAMVLSSSQHHNNEISFSVSASGIDVSLPITTTNALSVLASEAEDMGMDIDEIWYDCIVLAAWLLPSPVAAAAAMMHTASLLHALSAALAQCYAQFHFAAVYALGLAQGLLVLLAMQISQYQWPRSRSIMAADNQLTLSIIQRAMPTLGMWTVATCMQSSAWAYLCRGGGEGILAVGARVRLLCMCVVGAPVSLMWAFLCGHGVEGLCNGLAAAQVTQAVASFTSLMFRHSAQQQMPLTVTANPMEAGSEDGAGQILSEVGSEDGAGQILNEAGSVEDKVVEYILNLENDC